MREYTPTELADIAAKSQKKVRENIQAWLGWLGRRMAFLWRGRRQRKWATLCPLPTWPSGGSRYSLLYRSDYSSLQVVLVQWGGNLPGHVWVWKFIEEVQQSLRKLGMKQTIHTPVFEGPDHATFTAEMKVKYSSLPPASDMGHWHSCCVQSWNRYLWCWAIH